MIIGGTFVRRIFHIVHINLTMFFFPSLSVKKDVSRLTCRMMEGPTSIVGEIQRVTGCRLHIERGSTEVHPKISGKHIMKGKKVWNLWGWFLHRNQTVWSWGIDQSINESIKWPICPSIYQSIHEFGNLSVYLSTFPSIHLFTYPILPLYSTNFWTFGSNFLQSNLHPTWDLRVWLGNINREMGFTCNDMP